MKSYEQHEQDIANMLGGRLTSSSGRHWEKGDVRTSSMLLDAKSTSLPSYRLTHGVWMKLWKEAGMMSLSPALPIRFIRGTGIVERDLIVVPCGEVGIESQGEPKQSFAIKKDMQTPQAFTLMRGHSPARLVVLDLDDFIERMEDVSREA